MSSTCTGYAAENATASLAPFTFARRPLGPADVAIDIQFCGVCHTDPIMSLADPVRYHPEVEHLAPDEQAAQNDLIKSFRYIIGKTHKDLGHAQRGVHAKSHALLSGELRIHDDLPSELAQGIFAQGGRRYPAIIRISAIPGDPLADGVSGPRGFAFKLIGVDGERLPGAEEEVTQDVLMVSAPAFAAPTAKAFAINLKVLSWTTDRFEWAKVALSTLLRPLARWLKLRFGVDSILLNGAGGYPLVNPLGERYFTQAPIRFGDYIAKLDIVPESGNFRALTGRRIDLSGRPHAIREELARILAQEGGAWTLRAQLCRDLEAHPIEDASVVWPESVSPYLPVATLTVAPQASWNETRSRNVDDGIFFSPWNGIADHQPLGNVMRARRSAYLFSATHRTELNGCPLHEPRSLPDLDAAATCPAGHAH